MCKRVSIFLKDQGKLFATSILTAKGVEKVTRSLQAQIQIHEHDHLQEEFTFEIKFEEQEMLRGLMKEI